jgi:hypothetical protein
LQQKLAFASKSNGAVPASDPVEAVEAVEAVETIVKANDDDEMIDIKTYEEEGETSEGSTKSDG